MPTRRYVEEIGSAAMLATKRSAGVAPELNLRNLLQADNKARKRGNPLWLRNPKADVTRSPKHKKDSCRPKI